jgi:pyruvate dehydrogenase E2 component (dihydrolipoamide acetyltransferase)
MPKAGQSMEEGTLLKWRVSVGQTIKKGDVIFEIETDKATMEVEATDAGRLARIVVKEGEILPVLQPVAYLAENDADVDAFVATQGQQGTGDRGQGTADNGSKDTTPAEAGTPNKEHVARASAAASVSAGGRVKASPAARKLAAERGVDLHGVATGSGPGGRILSSDVPATGGDGTPIRRRMSQMRKAIARNLLQSKQTIPHFYVRLTINAESLLAFYQLQKAQYPCSINDAIVRACAHTIHEFPAFRSRIEGDEIVESPSANIGIAVGLDEGLVVPVVVGADRMTLQQIGAATRRLAESARGGKIEGMGQGCFTITNLGMFGTEEFAAIINPPEAAILAVGAVREAVVVKDGAMRPGKVMTVTLSADHRVVDGMLAAKFLARLKVLLENPAQLA